MYDIDEEPGFVVEGVLVEEGGNTDKALGKEVGREIREPIEDVESSTRFEHEEGDRLLHNQADHHGRPLDGGLVFRRYPEGKLKQGVRAHDGYGTITMAIFRPWKN